MSMSTSQSEPPGVPRNIFTTHNALESDAEAIFDDASHVPHKDQSFGGSLVRESQQIFRYGRVQRFCSSRHKRRYPRTAKTESQVTRGTQRPQSTLGHRELRRR